MPQGKGYGAYKQSLLGAKSYVTQPGTTLGVGSFMNPQMMQNLQQSFGGLPQAQLALGMDRARSAASSMGAGAMGASAPLMRRQAMIQGSDLFGQQAGQSAVLAAQEQQAFLDYIKSMEQLASQNYGAAMGQRGGNESWMDKNGQFLSAGVGALGNIGAGFLMRSDERVKEKSRNVSKAFDDFLSKINPKGYNYKGDPERSYGVMAQDLEKSAVGRTLVREVGGVKHIDTTKGFGVLLATLKRLSDKVEK